MAIQTINLGSAPSGAGGDTQRAANTKINANFTTWENAASRLVGAGADQVAAYHSYEGLSMKGYGGNAGNEHIAIPLPTPNTPENNRLAHWKQLTIQGCGFYTPPPVNGARHDGIDGYDPFIYAGNRHGQWLMSVQRGTGKITVAHAVGTGETNRSLPSFTVYTTKNTTIENGYLKPSSPILRLKHDSFVKEHEAEQLDIKVNNIKKGVYVITGTTGLRKNDGWFFAPPKDEHFNVLCMVEIEEEGDTIIVKTYAKKFDFEKVAIVPDYNNPVDIIGEVLLRFNDLPQDEVTDEPIE